MIHLRRSIDERDCLVVGLSADELTALPQRGLRFRPTGFPAYEIGILVADDVADEPLVKTLNLGGITIVLFGFARWHCRAFVNEAALTHFEGYDALPFDLVVCGAAIEAELSDKFDRLCDELAHEKQLD